MTLQTFVVRAALGAALVLGSAQGSAADAVATVSQIKGIALVNQGSEYVNAQQGMALYEGDRLMAMEGGSADLTFVDGCKVSVPDNQVVTIGNSSSCAAGTLSQRAVGPYLAAAPAANSGVPTAALVAGGVVGLAVIVAAVANSDDDDNDDPISP